MIVFVHGVPETAAIWDQVRSAIDADSTALSLPGFGCPRPDGFAATKDAYVEWLVGELSAFDEPVDLVGHDWGAPLVFRVAATRPELLRSWTIDVGGLMHPDYEWHDFAKLWQTPGDGEAFFESQTAVSVDERAAGVELLGVPHDAALTMAAAIDATMGGCILDLYRSAVPNCHAHWGPWSPIDVPGAVLVATEDPFGDRHKATEVAAAVGATVHDLTGAGHFWPAQVPEQAAPLLERIWASVP
jgi:pimeloyl-ACP methyl ester carboxylesterase